MDELSSSRTRKVRDVLTLLQIIVAFGVVIGASGSYFLIQDHVRSQGERITTLEHWKESHEEITARKLEYIESIKERVDACCPLYHGGKGH